MQRDATAWEEVQNGSNAVKVTALLVTSRGTILAGTELNGIYSSTDEGTSWTQSGLNSHFIGVAALAEGWRLGDGGGRVIAATTGDSVYLSVNGGSTWTANMDGVDGDRGVFQLVYSPRGYFVLSGGYGDLYRSTTSSGVAVTAPLSSMPTLRPLAQPLLGDGDVEFTLPRAGHVRLDIIDAMGRNVRSVADGEYADGTHRVHLRIADVPAGAYFCRLTSRGASALCKLIVLSAGGN
jgi:photosystem II stability/assembly factor-like uncharacterized protein